MWGLRERLGSSIVHPGAFFHLEGPVYRINSTTCSPPSCRLGTSISTPEIMSGLGRYPLNIPSLSEALLGSSSQRRDRLDYDFDDRRFRERERDRRDVDDYRRDSSGSRGRTSRDRYSPEPSYSSFLDEQHQDVVSYPLGHLGSSRSDRSSNRNDRNRSQNNRDRYRNNSSNNNRSQSNRGPANQGPGILGAKPGDRAIPELPANPLQVPALGMGGTGLGTGLTAQLAQQQQQLMAMVQTQSLLAAMQAQANANAQAQVQARVKPNMASPMGLLPTPLIPRNQSRDMQRQGRKRGRDDSFGRGGNYGNKRERFDNNRRQQGGNQRNNQQQNRGRQNQQNQQAKKTVIPEKVKEEKKEVNEDGEKVKEEEEEDEQEETAQGDEETEEANSSQEEEKPVKEVNESKPDVEFNDRPLPKAVNFIGEDVDALMISLFDKKRAKYICQQCKIICNIPTSFHKHLLGKRHARTILEKQGKELDVEEFKNFSMGITPVKNSEEDTISSETRSEEKGKEEVPQLSSPSSQQSSSDVEMHVNADFVKYTCDTRKTAKKEGNIITISSVTESRVKIDGFTSGRNMLGCEFVKAVSGFNCRLCKSFIRCGVDVIQHIKGKKHQIKYNTYIKEHPQYEELQLKRNKELESVLEPKEGEEVLLFEVLDKDLKTVASKPKSRRKESQTEEVQITKFVIASSEEAEQIHCEPTDLDVDMDGLDQVNDDSFLADESVEEQKGIVSTTEEEDNNLYDPAEITAVDDLLETEPEMETETEPTLEPTPAQPEEETEDFLPLTVDQPVIIEENEDAEETLPSTPKSSASPWKDEEPDTPDSPQEEPLKSPIEAAPVAVVPMAKRGRKGAAKGGGSIRGGAARGRGRGRGARRSGRAAARTDKAAKAKKGKVNEETDGNEDVTFMEGFEIIDEIGDGED